MLISFFKDGRYYFIFPRDFDISRERLWGGFSNVRFWVGEGDNWLFLRREGRLFFPFFFRVLPAIASMVLAICYPIVV